VHPVTGFQVASVHSIAVLKAMFASPVGKLKQLLIVVNALMSAGVVDAHSLPMI
jgi:hypothetical protein